METVTKFSQGTIWQWSKDGTMHYDDGVQGSNRPVLIVSNNTFNAHSSSVNCITITSVLKASPVHVPIHLSLPSHIQCEQMHTISKRDLYNFKGIVSEQTLKEVKEKLKIQFNINVDENLEILHNINTKLNGLNEKMQLDCIDTKQEIYTIELLKEIMVYMKNLNNDFAQYIQIAGLLKNNEIGINSEKPNDKQELSQEPFYEAEHGSNGDNEIKIRRRNEHRRYTDEEKEFIADENNSIEDLMKRFNYRSKLAASQSRSYIRRQMEKKAEKQKEV